MRIRSPVEIVPPPPSTEMGHPAYLFYRYVVKKDRGTFVLVIGGFVGLAGILTLPVERLHAWWWLPFVLDIGAGPVLAIFGGMSLIWKRIRKSSQ